MVREVRDMFSAVVSAVVQQASTEPVVYRNSVLLLSVCPFSWHEERCVMRSSLVSLLDKLCCMRTNKSDSSRTLSGMAWAGFQVLLDRIVQWEKDKGQIIFTCFLCPSEVLLCKLLSSASSGKNCLWSNKLSWNFNSFALLDGTIIKSNVMLNLRVVLHESKVKQSYQSLTRLPCWSDWVVQSSSPGVQSVVQLPVVCVGRESRWWSDC